MVEENKIKNTHYIGVKMCMDFPAHSELFYVPPLQGKDPVSRIEIQIPLSLVVEQYPLHTSHELQEAKQRILWESPKQTTKQQLTLM